MFPWLRMVFPWPRWGAVGRRVSVFLRRRDGAAVIEYGLIAALIAAVSIAGLTIFGDELNDTFDFIEFSLDEGLDGGDAIIEGSGSAAGGGP